MCGHTERRRPGGLSACRGDHRLIRNFSSWAARDLNREPLRPERSLSALYQHLEAEIEPRLQGPKNPSGVPKEQPEEARQ